LVASAIKNADIRAKLLRNLMEDNHTSLL
jgi:hypothetical protein